MLSSSLLGEVICIPSLQFRLLCDMWHLLFPICLILMNSDWFVLPFLQYYTDPVNGYVFRSKKDALRYIESGDISRCLFKPNKRQIQDEDDSTVSHICWLK